MSDTLRDFINRASFGVEKVFKKRGSIGPMIHFRACDGSETVMPLPGGDKDADAALMRAVLKKFEADRVVLMDEAWMLDTRGRENPNLTPEENERIRRFGVRNEPGRIEVIMFMAEDEREGHIMAQREIVRPVGRAPYLAALKIPADDHNNAGVSEGRFVGLLPRKTAAH